MRVQRMQERIVWGKHFWGDRITRQERTELTGKSVHQATPKTNTASKEKGSLYTVKKGERDVNAIQ